MTNFDQALHILEAARRPGDLRIHPTDAVEALANAGLLMPEEKPAVNWYNGNNKPAPAGATNTTRGPNPKSR